MTILVLRDRLNTTSETTREILKNSGLNDRRIFNMKKALSAIITTTMITSLLVGCGVASKEATVAATNSGTEVVKETEAKSNFDDVKADVTLSLSHQMAASHSINKTAEEFARLVKEKSEGKMAVDVYPSATLGTETENLQALTNGTLDCAIIAAEFYANYVDEAGILCLPFMYDSYDDAYEKLHSEAGNKIRDMILEKTDVRVTDWYVLAFRQIFTTNKAINNIDDLKGLIIRIPDSNTYKTTFSNLGAAPTAVAWGETYTALDTGLVSAVENIPESIMSASMQEVTKYVNETNHILGPTTISISNKVYQGLTDEQKKIIDEAAKEACEYGFNLTKDGSDANFAALSEAGLEVVATDVDSLKSKIDYSEYACAKSEEGKEILKALGK